MLVLITGKPNTGKTTIIKLLRSQYNVFVVDDYVKTIYLRNGVGYQAIKNSFGEAYVNENGVDTKALSQLVYSNHEMLNKLNNQIWPLIKVKLLELKNSKQNIIVEMAIYLVDYSNLFDDIFDKVIEIIADFKIDNDKQKYVNYYNKKAIKNIDLIIKNKNIEMCFDRIKSFLEKINF